jgi:hypothetical protein
MHMTDSKPSPRSIAPVVKKLRLNEVQSDAAYWRTRSYQERLQALEEIREEYHHWIADAQPGFQRVFTIIKRAVGRAQDIADIENLKCKLALLVVLSFPQYFLHPLQSAPHLCTKLPYGRGPRINLHVSSLFIPVQNSHRHKLFSLALPGSPSIAPSHHSCKLALLVVLSLAREKSFPTFTLKEQRFTRRIVR